MPRAFRMPAAAAIAVFLAMCCAAPAQGARQRGYEGSLLIVHRGTVVGAPELGYTASGKFSYSGRYRLSGRRIQKPETSTVKPSTGAWFDLVGSGKNSLDMTFDWAHRDQGRTETVYRRWKGGGDDLADAEAEHGGGDAAAAAADQTGMVLPRPEPAGAGAAAAHCPDSPLMSTRAGSRRSPAIPNPV